MLGQTLSHYKIESVLGSGGMGVVYRARDIRLDRPVALKVLKPELTSDENRLKRFIQEARAAAAVTHASIAQVYDVGEVDGTAFIVMELVEGQNVRRLIEQKELDLPGSVEIAVQVADGLSHAHRANIVHRDIKSDNIMVTPDGHAKLLDFGLAKLLDPQPEAAEKGTAPDKTQTAQMQTAVGAVIGTVAYMSPEQARGYPVSRASDVFSLGIVLYEMVTGELPFKGLSAIDTMHSIVFDEAKPVTDLRRNLPPGLHEIISRCLRKSPAQRYSDAGALAADLKRLKKEMETGTQAVLFGRWDVRRAAERLRSALSQSPKSAILITAALTLIVAAMIINVNLSAFIGPAVVALLSFRYIRNRKRRMLKRFTTKASKMQGIKAVTIAGDRITVIAEKAQAKIYITLNSLVDEINRKLYFGKPVSLTIRDDLTREEFQKLLRETGVVFVSDDATIDRLA